MVGRDGDGQLAIQQFRRAKGPLVVGPLVGKTCGENLDDSYQHAMQIHLLLLSIGMSIPWKSLATMFFRLVSEFHHYFCVYHHPKGCLHPPF